MRGNLPQGCRVQSQTGSIPAHAGKPWSPRTAISRSGVYPRPCGETRQWARGFAHAWGLSPPMRGNRLRIGSQCRKGGSIPAHAGKPMPAVAPQITIRVYPRPCGETVQGYSWFADIAGLSPPMRGNRRSEQSAGGADGSIPAHAGKPPTLHCFRRTSGVYPRPCGETP